MKIARTSRKQTLRLVSVNVALTGILLFGIEILVRLAYPDITELGTDKGFFTDSVYSDSPGLRANYSGRSNGALREVDSNGFWRYSSDKRAELKAWLLLGDSVTMGIGVDGDSTFAGRIAHRLDGVLNLINPSVLGYASDDYLNVATALLSSNPGRRHDLEIARITVFWCLNDVYGSFPGEADPGHEIREVGGDFLWFIRRHLRTYQFLKAHLFDRSKTYFQHFLRMYKALPEDATLINELREINEIAVRAGARFEVVLLPVEYQLRHPVNPEVRYPQNLMIRKLDEAGITVHDPLEFMVEATEKPAELYLYGDGVHFSDKGHELVAEFVLRDTG